MELEKILKAETDESGNIPAARISAIITAIKREVGQEFVERNRYNERLTEIENLKSEIAKAEEKATTADQLQIKYDALKAEYKEYKSGIKQREEYDAKAAKFRDILKAAGIPDKYHKSIGEVSANIINKIEVDENGNVKDAETLTKNARDNWSDFIPVINVTGTPQQPKLGNNTGSKQYTTKDEIMSIKDPETRQAQIAANIGLFTNKE